MSVTASTNGSLPILYFAHLIMYREFRRRPRKRRRHRLVAVVDAAALNAEVSPRR